MKRVPSSLLRYPARVIAGGLLFNFAPMADAGSTDLIGPAGSGGFGASVTLLPNGNIVVIDQGYDAPGPVLDVGAVYLYDASTLNLISTLTGSQPGDSIGSQGVTVLPSGNFVVRSGKWSGHKGASTWANGSTGISGTVSAANSLVGSATGDLASGITVLSNGNYVVSSSDWDNGAVTNAGAVTWANGSTGVTGTVSAANSLVGSSSGDRVGGGITILSNGNFFVESFVWNGKRGAVTWVNGATGITGTVSASNSLVGSDANDQVGSGRITLLPDGNGVVGSSQWNNTRGAVTWVNGSTGITGPVSASNSLVGSIYADQLGSGGITVLPNGNYVVASAGWNGGAGAVTWHSNSTGITGTVSGSNSLVGSYSYDNVGSGGVTILPNSNYLVRSIRWNLGRGAVTWASGTTTTSATVADWNSLVGSNNYDYIGEGGITVLSNGNYVVRSRNWNGSRGAVTWASGSTGLTGPVSVSNSLIGPGSSDALAYHPIVALPSGNYLVVTPNWNQSRGAVTWGNGSTGITGEVSDANSLVGSTAYDSVALSGVYTLSNGNYVVPSTQWSNTKGAITWGNGSAGVAGPVSASNSLVGSTVGDRVGFAGVTTLPDGNYVINSIYWDHGDAIDAGASTWADGSTGITGTVSAANSLVGSTADDRVGSNSVVLTNGNYIVSSRWSGDRGAVTWVRSSTGITGTVSPSNSLVGSTAGDGVGGYGVIPLPDGNYVVNSPSWDNGALVDAGAVTWANGSTGMVGTLSPSNSLVGSTSDDRVGDYGIAVLSDGSYVVKSSSWDNGTVQGAGAITLGLSDGSTSGTITALNSVVGTVATFGGFDLRYVYDATRFRLVAGRPNENIVTAFTYNPMIGVTGNNVAILNGSSTPKDTDHTAFGLETSRTFSIRNSAASSLLHLTGSPVIALSGPQAGDFSVASTPLLPLINGASAPFAISFSPSGPGTRSATVTIASDDPANHPFTFAISGSGLSPLEAWKRTYFGTAAQLTGELEDFDSDGVINLLEFAFGTNPNDLASGSAPLQYTGTLAGGGALTTLGQPITAFETISGGINVRALFVRRKDHVTDHLIYTPQFSVDLSVWVNSPDTPAILAESDTHQIVSVPYPSATAEKNSGFLRISVSLTP